MKMMGIATNFFKQNQRLNFALLIGLPALILVVGGSGIESSSAVIVIGSLLVGNAAAFLYLGFSGREASESLQKLQNVEYARQKAQRDLESLLNGVPYMLGYWDKTLHNRFANKAYANWFSVEPHTLVGCHISKLMSKQRLDVAMPLINKALRGEKCDYMVTLNNKSDQSPSHILVQYLPDVVGNDCKGFYAIGQDVSEKHLAKQNLLLRTKLLELASEIANVASIIINPISEEVSLTPEAQHLLNIPQTSFSSLGAFCEHVVCQTQKQTLELHIREAIAQHGRLSIEFQTRDELQFFGCTGECVVIQDKPSFLMSLVNITESTKIKSRLIEAKEHADLLTAAKSQFVATMSHEIRNPLHTILGLCNLLNDQCETENQRDLTEKLKHCSEDLVHLLTNSLDSFRMDRGELHFEEEEFDLWALISNLANHLYGSAKGRELGLKIYTKGKIQRFWVGDSFRIKQMVGNLISNACKFTEAGHIHLCVEQSSINCLKFTIEDTGLGIPEASLTNLFDQLIHKTPATARLYGGSGLGLNLVKSLVEHIGGNIQISSSEGRGTFATLQIPLKAGEKQISEISAVLQLPAVQLVIASSVTDLHVREMLTCTGIPFVDHTATCLITDCPEIARVHLAAHRDHRVMLLPTLTGKAQSYEDQRDIHSVFQVQGPVHPATVLKWLDIGRNQSVEPSAKPEKIMPVVEIVVLLVEDVKMTRMVIKSLLAKRGIQCLEAENGERALEIIKSQGHSIDFVLMDINMPVMNGIDATLQIRESEEHNGLVVYALTGEDEETTAHSRDWSIFDKVLSKPLKIQTLEVLIDEHRTAKLMGCQAVD